MARPILAGLLCLALTGPGVRSDEGARPGGAAGDAAVRSSADALEAPGLARAGLTELREDPEAFLGQRIRFVLQLKGEVAAWNPYLTRFGPGEFARYEAWGDESFTWNLEVFQDPAPFLFARRDGEVEEMLRRAHSYERFEAVARVREVFLDEPWIELESVRWLPRFVGEGTILHATRALLFQKEGRTELALEQFDRARAGPLPAHARAELERLSEECRREQERARP